MIAKVIRGRGFGGLARYLAAGRTGQEAGRVAWAEARNLPSAHPRDAALFMRATAAEAPQVQRPVYHLSLAWDPNDRVNRTQIVAVAERVLRELGLDEHQALFVAHRDTAHPHVHLMVNRVHPETGRAWAGRHDYRALEEILRRWSASSTSVRCLGTTGDSRDFAEAASWSDLEARLARHGLRVEARGRGMVVTDGRESLKCSVVAREASRTHLEMRFGERYVEYRRERAGLRERLKSETDARIREMVDDALRRIGAESEVRIREAVGQATADLAYQAERMSRIAAHVAWFRAATVALAMAAGGIGGTVVLLILRWVS